MSTPQRTERTKAELVIGITSRALFNLEKEHEIFEKQGIQAYCEYQVAHKQETLEPGVAFQLIRSFLNLNQLTGKPLVEVCVLSRNNANTSLRLFNSIAAHKLDIRRVALTGGESIYPYAIAYESDLVLSAHAATVSRIIKEGVASALVYPTSRIQDRPEEVIRIALDGDGVIFDLEAEEVFKTKGLASFDAHEKRKANVALGAGPMAKFLKKLSALQAGLGDKSHYIQTALITARGNPAHERAIRTLRSWNVHIDSAFFLNGSPKKPIVQAFGAQLFFDNQENHCLSCADVGPTAQVLLADGAQEGEGRRHGKEIRKAA